MEVLDARSPGRYEGVEPEPRQGVRSGHIPGAINVPYYTLKDDMTGQLKPAPAILRVFERYNCWILFSCAVWMWILSSPIIITHHHHHHPSSSSSPIIIIITHHHHHHHHHFPSDCLSFFPLWLNSAGVDLSDKNRPIVSYCGSGITACTLLLGLHMIGHKNIVLYDGSWVEYVGFQ